MNDSGIFLQHVFSMILFGKVRKKRHVNYYDILLENGWNNQNFCII